MNREQLIEEKRKEVAELTNQFNKIMVQVKSITKRPPAKKASTSIKRACEIVSLSVKARQILIQQHIILSAPIPKSDFPKGGMYHQGGEIFISTDGPEIIHRIK